MSKRATKKGGRASGEACSSTTADEQPKERLRQKTEKQYIDGMDSDSDEEGYKHSYSVEEKLASKKFPMYAKFFIRDMKGSDVDLAYFQTSGFNMPIYVHSDAVGLGMTMPDSSFSVTDVRNLVGARRIIEVMDCATQKNSEMFMADFEEYYVNAAGADRTRVLNVLSLEVSFTKLDPLVVCPKVVRSVDWIDNVWPRHLKEAQVEGTNDMSEMKYPKVQKYCLMSVKGCYTDFHIDFGGSSVWYHIVRGCKVFWLIPPNETNLKLYEQWTLSGKQGDVFFGDMVEKCGMITLEAGNTFFIPSGWIHAVYTPEDTLVFGGNFLHSFAIEKQIRCAQIEENIKVPQKFRFPFFTELQWFALDKYVYHLLARTHLHLEEDTLDYLLGSEDERDAFAESLDHPHITPQEHFGLKAIIMYIHALAVSKKNVPRLLPRPIELVKDVRIIVQDHKNDDLSDAITGKPLLYWPGIKNDRGFTKAKAKKKDRTRDYFLSKKSLPKHREKKERVPCKICQACISPDCGKCEHCADMLSFGGPGLLRKPCLIRCCLQPLLKIAITCNICGLDGWYAETNMRLVERPPGTCALMECSLCYEVTHPTCVTDYGVDGFIKMDLPNSWECPKCIRAAAERVKEEGADDLDSGGGAPPSKIKKEDGGPFDGGGGGGGGGDSGGDGEPLLKRAISSGSDANLTGYQLFSVKGRSDQPKHQLRVQLADQVMSASTKPMKQPKYVVRPPPQVASAQEVYDRRRRRRTDGGGDVDLKLESQVMLHVFRRLSSGAISNCAAVCKAWSSIVQDPSLWTCVKLPQRKITSRLLSLIVHRQPIKLVLDWSTISKQQLTWLLPRLPQLRSLSLCGLEYNSSVIALSTVNAAMLQELDLGHVTNFNDSSLYKLLSAPGDSRPGLLDKKSRQKHLRKLSVAGTEISDISLRYLTQYLSQLSSLDVSGCWKLTDAGLAMLAVPDARTVDTLTAIDISQCKMVTNVGLLQHLNKCINLKTVRTAHSGVMGDALKKFVDDNKDRKLKVYSGSLIDLKPASSPTKRKKS